MLLRSVLLTTILLAVAASADAGYDYTTLLHGPQCKPHRRGGPDDAPWARPRRMTVVTDSVLLGAGPALRARKPCWHVAMIGRPFLDMPDAARAIARRRRVAPVAVIGLGYNSSWERDRKHYAFWAKHFDDDAARLLRVLRRHGARQFVWLTVRQPTRRTTPRSAYGELPLAWYLKHVNERIRRLDARRDDVVLADWNAASRRNDLTYDAIHVNPRGAKLMVTTIRRAISDASHRYKKLLR